jgi:hypothetical protein
VNSSLFLPCPRCEKEFLIEAGTCSVKLPIRYKRELGVAAAVLDYLAELLIRDRPLCGKKPAVRCCWRKMSGYNMEVNYYYCSEHQDKAWGFLVTDEAVWPWQKETR